MCPQFQLSRLHWSKILSSTSSNSPILQIHYCQDTADCIQKEIAEKRGPWRLEGRNMHTEFPPPWVCLVNIPTVYEPEISTAYFNTCTIVCWAVTPRKSFFPVHHFLTSTVDRTQETQLSHRWKKHPPDLHYALL